MDPKTWFRLLCLPHKSQISPNKNIKRGVSLYIVCVWFYYVVSLGYWAQLHSVLYRRWSNTMLDGIATLTGDPYGLTHSP